MREWVGVHTDITAQRQAEEALRRNDKLAIAGRLAASIAHEINNPLEAVTNLLYLLQQTSLDPEQQSLCQTMTEEVHRVSEIANHTLKFHRQATAANWTRMEDLVKSVLALFSGRLRYAEIQAKCRFHSTRKIYGRDGELRQVIANLVGNAVDAMAGHTSSNERKHALYLRTRDCRALSGETGVMFTIADTGPGIPPFLYPTIFEPFFTTKGEKGTGLGLWISSEIIRKHEGRIKVRSSQLSTCQGTIFRIFLPVQPTRQA